MPIPQSLYIHIPWCVRKCPYCDFNSHALRGAIDEAGYVRHLLADLAHDLDPRPIESIFIGGGTPSLFSAAAIAALLDGINRQSPLPETCEITLEANPGTFEQAKFADYRAAGVNRLSIGVQSFDAAQLHTLGRIHNRDEAIRAVAIAEKAGFSRINLDLMFALPGQDVAGALADLRQATALAPEHISWYQLTLEPNTAFYANPPALPDSDTQIDIFEAGSAHLSAHGKQTRDGVISRSSKYRAPGAYQKAAGNGENPYRDHRFAVPRAEQPFEFMMNALRLKDGVPTSYLHERSVLTLADLRPTLARLIAQGLIDPAIEQRLKTTERGFALLNNVLDAFL